MKNLYAQRADLLKIVQPAFTSIDAAVGKPVSDDAVLNAIMHAQGEVDAYLKGVYDIPLATIPEKIITITSAIALRNIYKDLQVEPHEFVGEAFGAAVSQLQDIRRKKINGVNVLKDETEAQSPAAAVSVSSKKYQSSNTTKKGSEE